MSFKLLTEHHSEFLSLKGGCRGSSESILVKILHRWKLHVIAAELPPISVYPLNCFKSHVLFGLIDLENNYNNNG